MSRNLSEDRLEKRVVNTINDLSREAKANKTDQIQPNGYLPLVTGTTDPIGAPNGAVYYNSSTNKLRLKKNTGWVDVI